MNEDPDDGNGLPAMERVLRNPEMLDTIFSFMNLETLLKLRIVSRQWRLVSDMSLKRRFRLIQVTPNIPVHCQNGTDTFSGLIRETEQPRNSFWDLAVPVFEINLILNNACHYYQWFNFNSNFNSNIALVSTILNIDWNLRVNTLAITGCLTIEHWNAIGIKMLNKFPSVRRLVIDLPKDTSSVLPLCYTELQNALQQEENTVYAVTNFDLQCGLPLLDQEKPVGFCYDFLASCPNLEVSGVELLFADQNLAITRLKFMDLANSQKLYVDMDWSSQDECAPGYSASMGDSYLDVFESIEHAENSRKYEPVIIHDIVRLFRVLPVRPRKLCVPLHPEIISGVEAGLSVNLVDLVLQGCSVPGLFEDALESLITNPAFVNVKKLQWDTTSRRYVRSTINSSAIKSLGATTMLKNVKTLIFDGSDRFTKNAKNEDEAEAHEWIWTDINKIVPNVQIFVKFFSDETIGGELATERERTALLYLAKSFSQLKHLVVVDERFGFSNPEASCSEFTENELDFLQGLNSVTVIVHRTSWFEDYLTVYAKACLSVPSIRKLGVYCPNMILQRPVREILSNASLVVPEELEIETGSQDVLEGNIIFEGMEDSHIKWEDFRSIGR